MINVKEQHFASFLNKINKTMMTKTDKQLVSWTEKINKVDLLTVFDESKKLQKKRLFWMDRTKEFAFVGIGHVETLTAEQQRFHQLQMKWDNLVKDAIIHDPYKQQGTGIVAIGGMSFDPKRERTNLWKNFPTSRLTIPEFIIVKNEVGYFLTVNRYINGKLNIDDVKSDINNIKKMLQEKTLQQKDRQQIVSKKEIQKEQWKETVAKAVTEIKNEKAKKIVLAREMRITLNKQANIATILKKLIQSQQNSYIFAFEHGDDCFVGATPERLIQVRGKALLSTCLAGTAPRGKNEQEDKRIANELLHDHKNREEHDYVVQMIKSNLIDICETFQIASEPIVLSLRHLQHLYTPISAELKDGHTIFDLIKKLHPTPALGGVPKEETLAFIRENEQLDRGWYGAPIGWLDSNENSEFVVAIRSGLVQGNEVSLFAGCGVMGDSTPEMEYEETNVKFLPMLHALEDNDE